MRKVRAERASVCGHGLALVLAMVALALMTVAPSHAQTLYKWIDQDGRTHYSNKPPPGFKGEVVRIEPDPSPPAVPGSPAPSPKPREAAEEEKPREDIGARRKAVREGLEARLRAASQKVEAARKALAEGEIVQEGEHQVVQQRHDRKEATWFTKAPPPPRSNCMSRKGVDGKPIWLCPTVIPGEGYFERRKVQEEELRKAEEELAAAEFAYRRSVD